MKNLPISVCMPMYNASRYLRECIDSILAQTFTDFELLIVDDGSTDESVKIVESYHDPRIRLIKNKHDYIASLNLLLSEAKGKYIARMDADDVMLPERLDIQYEYMEEHPEVGVLATSAIYLGTTNFVCDYSSSQEFISSQDLLCANPLINPTTFLRVKFFREYNIQYEETFKYAEDYRLWTKCAMFEIPIAVIPLIGIKYRSNETQVSNQKFTTMHKRAEKVKKSFAQWICKKSNVSYRKPTIRNTKNLVTVIIPFLNEGIEVVETVKNLRQKVSDNVEIIVINDFSTDEINYQQLLLPYNVYYILNHKRKGVAASRDLGVELCKTPFFLLLDAHMRVYDNSWLTDIICILKENDRQILCTQTKQLWKNEDEEIIELKEAAPVYGAYATFNKHSLSPGIDWNYIQSDKTKSTQDVACVLGAGYAASKRYWLYLRGLKGLRLYGCDEVYISLKTWMEGGKCTLLKNHSFGHIYRNNAPYKITPCSYVFNYLLVAYITLPLTMWYQTLACCKIAKPIDYRKAWDLFQRNKKQIDELKAYHLAISNVNPMDIVKMNCLIAKQHIKNISNRLKVAEQISQSIPQKDNIGYGIVEGKMAELIWISHWNKYVQKQRSILQQQLFEEIKDAVISHRLPYNFRYGLCGIGWGLLYLYFNDLLSDIDERILQVIDSEIQAIDIANLPEKSLYYGTTGLIAYVVCRECYNQQKGINTYFHQNYLHKIKTEEQCLIKTSKEHIAVYYSYLHQDGKEKVLKDFIPTLEDWMPLTQTIPNNPNYWSYRLDNGCLGYSIPTLFDRTHNHNKNT